MHPRVVRCYQAGLVVATATLLAGAARLGLAAPEALALQALPVAMVGGARLVHHATHFGATMLSTFALGIPVAAASLFPAIFDFVTAAFLVVAGTLAIAACWNDRATPRQAGRIPD